MLSKCCNCLILWKYGSFLKVIPSIFAVDLILMIFLYTSSQFVWLKTSFLWLYGVWLNWLCYLFSVTQNFFFKTYQKVHFGIFIFLLWKLLIYTLSFDGEMNNHSSDISHQCLVIFSDFKEKNKVWDREPKQWVFQLLVT